MSVSSSSMRFSSLDCKPSLTNPKSHLFFHQSIYISSLEQKLKAHDSLLMNSSSLNTINPIVAFSNELLSWLPHWSLKSLRQWAQSWFFLQLLRHSPTSSCFMPPSSSSHHDLVISSLWLMHHCCFSHHDFLASSFLAWDHKLSSRLLLFW